jgi:hypothetical protein
VLAPAVALGCAALALLAGALPASAAAQSPAARPAGPAKMVTATVTIGATRASTALAARPAASAQCAPGVSEFNRSDSCWEDLGTITFLVNNEVVGEEEFTLEQSIHLKAASKDWTENDTILNVTAIKEVPAVVDIVMTATCGSPCRASAHFSGVLKKGLRGTVSYTDTVGNKKSHETETSYDLAVTAPGFVSGPPPKWNSGLKYRCDQGVAVSGTGCVYPEFTPTLVLSHKQYGAAAYLVAFAQQLMTKHWGYQPDKGAPLTRASSSQGGKNRAKICNSTFHPIAGIGAPAPGTPHPWKDSDSCDEFPFASTWQSGAQAGAVGQNCVQLEAVHNTTKGNEATQWSTAKVIGTANLNASCVRGHIPGKENSAVGGAYGAFIKSQRLFVSTGTSAKDTTDKFWVFVTT